MIILVYLKVKLDLILAESFDGIAIDKDITPNLYRMVTEGYNFTNFYTSFS